METNEERKRIWVTGAGGLIGNYLVQTAPAAFTAIPLSRAVVDLTDWKAVTRLFTQQRPDAVIHCAALSKSPACQKDPSLASLLNVDVTRHLSELAAELPFIFFSTDLVFDGSKGDYHEEASTNPLSVYAETKVKAEQLVARNQKHTIIRTSLNGGKSPSGDRGFNEEMQRAWQSGQKLKMFVDEFRCPMGAIETARITWQLLEQSVPGVFHVAGGERLSRWEIGQLLASYYRNLPAQIEPGSLKEYQGPARSPDTSLNCEKIEQLLTRRMPRFSEWLRNNDF